MSSSASTSASSAGSRKRRFEKENKTILSSLLPEDESDEDYVDEESDDSEDDEVIDGEHEIIYIDDDEVDIPSLPGESKIDSAQVDAWAGSLPGNKAVPTIRPFDFYAFFKLLRDILFSPKRRLF